MKPINTDTLRTLLEALQATTAEDRDELLTDILVVPYPTRVAQDN